MRFCDVLKLADVFQLSADIGVMLWTLPKFNDSIFHCDDSKVPSFQGSVAELNASKIQTRFES